MLFVVVRDALSFVVGGIVDLDCSLRTVVMRPPGFDPQQIWTCRCLGTRSDHSGKPSCMTVVLSMMPE